MKNLLPIIVLLMISESGFSQAGPLQYPVFPQNPTTLKSGVITYTDPYLGLEDDQSTETKNWVVEENKVTQNFLIQIPFIQTLKDEIKQAFNFPKEGTPIRAGKFIIIEKNNGLQNQSVIYIHEGSSLQGRVLLDPNTYSTKGTVAISLVGFDPDYTYATFSVQEAGSDWQTLKVIELATGTILKDEIQWVKFSGASWDRQGFYYSRYPKPDAKSALTKANSFHQVYYHKLGTSQKKDVLVFDDRKAPQRYYSANLTEDLRFLVLSKSEGTYGTEIWVRDLLLGEKTFRPICTGFTNDFAVLDNEGADLIVLTDFQSPNKRVVRISTINSDPTQWVDIVKEGATSIATATTAGGWIFSSYLEKSKSKIVACDYVGNQVKEVVLPGMGTASGFGGLRKDKSVFYTFTSFTTPYQHMELDLHTFESRTFSRPQGLVFDPSDYITEQRFFTSTDGTKVPLFLVYHRNHPPTPESTLLMYGYGGFSIPLTPSFSASRMVFLNHGGVFALVNCRGGSEFGEDWHQGGMLLKKQQVFDDFISAAEYLIAEKQTSPKRLAIQGGSNGGLLVGACMTQRPDLFGVCIPQVGVLDMMRYHKFTVGWGWKVEYGDPEDSTMSAYLYHYSPYHHVLNNPSLNYPPCLIMTGDHDDRVVPAHSFKFASALQQLPNQSNPHLIRIATDAGHGAGKPLDKLIDELADMYGFIFYMTQGKL